MFQLINRPARKCYALSVAGGLKQKMLKILHERSFTLIELLVVVSIIVLFSGLSLAAYNNFNETKKLEAETKKFIEVLELAKKKIASGDKANFESLDPVNDYSGCDLTAYKVVITPPNEYSLKATVCGNGSGDCDVTAGYCNDINIHSYSSSQNITFSSTGDVVFHLFSKTSFIPTPIPPLTAVCITTTNTLTGNTQIIKVDQSGTITIVPSC
jgi:type II secretory pathway pseudopilin PulG